MSQPRAVRRPRNQPAEPAVESVAAPVEPVEDDEDDEDDEDSDEDEDDEEGEPGGDGPGVDGVEDEGRVDARSETERENDKAALLGQEVFRVSRRAREREIAKAKGGMLDVRKADEAARDAAQGVRERHQMGRRPGFYVASPFVATDETGKRCEYVVSARIPDSVVKQLRNSGDLKKLIKGKEIKDLTRPALDF